MSSELVRDGAPVRLMLLGEKLIAFRDSAGRVGVMDHRCPHRCASLFLGPQRGGGHSLHLSRLEVRRRRQLRRHAEPAAAGLQGEGEGQGLQGGGARRRRVGLHGHARGGAAAAGVRDPRHSRGRGQGHLHPARLQLPAGARGRDRHLAFRLPARRPRRSGRPLGGRAGAQHRHQPRARVSSRRYRHGARSTPATAMSAPGQTYWRFGNFLFPFWSQAPNGEFGTHMHARGWVPLDDEHTMFVFSVWKKAVHAGVAAAARLQGRLAHRRHRARQQAVAEHDRLARALAHGGERRATTGRSTATPSGATGSTAGSTASTCRTRRSPRAWARSSTTSSSISRRRTR